MMDIMRMDAQAFILLKDALLQNDFIDTEHMHTSVEKSDCVGAIDGTLVDAWVSALRQNIFRGRKSTVSQNVLAVCDFDMLFTFINSRWDDSAHDNVVLVDSITRVDLQFPHPPNDMDPFFMEVDNEMVAKVEANGFVGDQADYADMSQHELTYQLNFKDAIATAMWQNHVGHG
ncbi:uncharacterized protein LOC114255783 [Camellia sinensis]|uniref:uncharacterized protein LOC114255783 n=1 Tax=Camellia sinensis TaxID=4442 RepID=UPI0010368508|nr:uncharacterized protein LOC114255783 [Camellia sinensis]